MKVFAYLRQSTKKSTGKQVFSLDAQKDAVKKYAKLQGYKITEIIQEEQSAWHTGRPKFKALIEKSIHLAQKEESVVIIFPKTDRATRNIEDQAMLEFAMNNNVICEFIDIGKVLNTASGRFQLGISVLASRLYSDLISERIREQHNLSIKSNLYPSGCKIGYLPREAKKQPHKIDKEKAKIIKEIYKRIANREPTASVEKWTRNEAKLRSHRGKIISISSFYKIIKDPFYHGNFMWKSKEYMGNHEAIVSKKLFDAVQYILTNGARIRKDKHEYIFLGIAHCSSCGKMLNVSTNKGIKYYRCTKCKVKYINEATMEKSFIQFLSEQKISKEKVQESKEELKEFFNTEMNKIVSKRTILNQKITTLSIRLKNAKSKWLDGKMDDEEWGEAKKEIKEERNELREELKTIFKTEDIKISTIDTLIDNIVELLNLALVKYEKLAYDKKQLFAKKVLSNLKLEQGIAFVQATKTASVILDLSHFSRLVSPTGIEPVSSA